jgi:hypothetical protein
MVELNEYSFYAFHCSAEWHLAKIKSNIATLLYNHARRLSKDSGVFSASVGNVAHYFRVHPNSVSWAIKKLLAAEFFILLKSGKDWFETSDYRVVDHTEWAAQHANGCCQKEDFGWANRQLGQLMFAASGQKIKLRDFQVENLLNTGIPEDEIFQEWKTFLAENTHQPKKWRNEAGFRFWMWFKTRHQAQVKPAVAA